MEQKIESGLMVVTRSTKRMPEFAHIRISFFYPSANLPICFSMSTNPIKKTQKLQRDF